MLLGNQILSEFPELQTCIGCGTCTATCTAAGYSSFNIRKVHTLVRRGEYQGLKEMLEQCMFCGKCRLVCPRGINTRSAIERIKKQLETL